MYDFYSSGVFLECKLTLIWREAINDRREIVESQQTIDRNVNEGLVHAQRTLNNRCKNRGLVYAQHIMNYRDNERNHNSKAVTKASSASCQGVL